jgi:hypothetical protein
LILGEVEEKYAESIGSLVRSLPWTMDEARRCEYIESRSRSLAGRVCCELIEEMVGERSG